MSSRWVKMARGAHQGTGAGPEEVGSLGWKWGTMKMIQMRLLQSQEM